MSVYLKDPCPCGSGKRYKQCHYPKDQARKQRTTTLLVAAFLAVAVAVFAMPRIREWQATRAATKQAATDAAKRMAGRDTLALVGTQGGVGAAGIDRSGMPASQAFGSMRPASGGAAPVTDPNQLTLKPPNSGALAPGEHPKPWEYDVANNRYYDPREGHKHWHTGPPPADPNNPDATMPQVSATTTNGQPVTITSSGGTVISTGTALAPGEHPKDWEYDAKGDRYYDPNPGHKHWHSGKPPAPGTGDRPK